MKARADVDTAQLRCNICGVQTNALCDCGVGYSYMPPIKAAIKAVKAHPEQSDRKLAEETGVSRQTLDRARAKLGGSNGPPEKRIGLDGKKHSGTKTRATRAPTPAADKARDRVSDM